MHFLSSRNLLAGLSMLLLSLTWNAANAQVSPERYQAGKHYTVLEQPVRTRDSDKVEVVELFWYGCPHCYHFEPLIKAWKSKAPDYVDFWQSPAVWNNKMKLHAQAFFAAKALGVLDKLHEPIFTALVVERKRLASPGEIASLFANYGVSEDDFNKAFNSFGVTSQVKQADARARSYQITGTPELVVNGKYRVSAGMAGGQAEMLKVTDFLIAKERAAMKGE